MKEIRCPNCNKLLLYHIAGENALYENKCRRCKALIIIYSAGQTILAEKWENPLF